MKLLRPIEASGLAPALELIETLPGLPQDSAVSVLAEVGPDRSVFPAAARLSSWAGLCPGHRRKCRQGSGRPDYARKPLVTGDADAMGVGGLDEKERLSQRKVRAAGGRRQEASAGGCGSQPSRTGLSGPRNRDALPGKSGIPPGTPNPAPDSPSSAGARAIG
jgi:Transposase IS116/IS110/IS902 family